MSTDTTQPEHDGRQAGVEHGQPNHVRASSCDQNQVNGEEGHQSGKPGEHPQGRARLRADGEKEEEEGHWDGEHGQEHGPEQSGALVVSFGDQGLGRNRHHGNTEEGDENPTSRKMHDSQLSHAGFNSTERPNRPALKC